MHNLQLLFTKALQLHQANKLTEAESFYLDILKQLPDNTNILANLGILYRDLGHLDRAESYCRKALSTAADDPGQYVNLGAVLEAKGDRQGAKNLYERALKIAPDHPKVLNNLGKLLHEEGELTLGMSLVAQAIQNEPNYLMALNNLGVIHSDQGNFSDAVKCFERCLALDPDNPHALYNQAGAYNAQNKMDAAIPLLKRLLHLHPEHECAKHLLAALAGEKPATAPIQYIQDVFDKYAPRFDNHLQSTLGYTAPGVLADMVSENFPGRSFDLALDLGCGTGLSGIAFRQMCDQLVGVDISKQMLVKANEKKMYDRLECQEIYTFLTNSTDDYDLFILADVLIYLGDPKPLFAFLARRSAKNGVLALSVETTAQVVDYQLQPSGRYSHNPAYITQCATVAGFIESARQPHQLRKENGVWLQGMLFLFHIPTTN